MINLYLHEKTAYGRANHAASGLQPFHQQDVSTGPGCINRVLRSTLRLAAQMQVVGPAGECSADCERVLRTLPLWFGHEESLLEYAQDAERYSTLVAIYDGGVVAFITLHEHFPSTWEVHCIAVEAQYRNQGVGRMLQAAAESWLIEKGVRLLQVKTLAPSFASAEYAETREFYRTAGYIPVEVFPELWEVGLPVLQLVKVLESAA